jgi:hypothetical protein
MFLKMKKRDDFLKYDQAQKKFKMSFGPMDDDVQYGIIHCVSVAIGDVYPDPDFFHPGSRIQQKKGKG